MYDKRWIPMLGIFFVSCLCASVTVTKYDQEDLSVPLKAGRKSDVSKLNVIMHSSELTQLIYLSLFGRIHLL